mmetsp:Transcript_11424/g.70145  ORF Transcript_11424/g.70145 Transcript_11424/m.70145 type:complete len:235 (+) Transcript_11424:3787-4491(+)
MVAKRLCSCVFLRLPCPGPLFGFPSSFFPLDGFKRVVELRPAGSVDLCRRNELRVVGFPYGTKAYPAFAQRSDNQGICIVRMQGLVWIVFFFLLLHQAWAFGTVPCICISFVVANVGSSHGSIILERGHVVHGFGSFGLVSFCALQHGSQLFVQCISISFLEQERPGAMHRARGHSEGGSICSCSGRGGPLCTPVFEMEQGMVDFLGMHGGSMFGCFVSFFEVDVFGGLYDHVV